MVSLWCDPSGDGRLQTRRGCMTRWWEWVGGGVRASVPAGPGAGLQEALFLLLSDHGPFRNSPVCDEGTKGYPQGLNLKWALVLTFLTQPPGIWLQAGHWGPTGWVGEGPGSGKNRESLDGVRSFEDSSFILEHTCWGGEGS